MKGIKIPVIGVTALWLLFQLSPVLGMPVITFVLLVVLPVAIIWMVVRVLKDGQPSDRTFDEQFYDDRAERRT